MLQARSPDRRYVAVSVLFSEPKIPQWSFSLSGPKYVRPVSVLFSEPKIPQLIPDQSYSQAMKSFSALQRAENSSITLPQLRRWCFPCFSALQRAENSSIRCRSSARSLRGCFSALQRAENSSMYSMCCARPHPRAFQCSSASRKFLNVSSSPWLPRDPTVSVLFSEPKIPQSNRALRVCSATARVSVLFSEPKIPQFGIVDPP